MDYLVNPYIWIAQYEGHIWQNVDEPGESLIALIYPMHALTVYELARKLPS